MVAMLMVDFVYSEEENMASPHGNHPIHLHPVCSIALLHLIYEQIQNTSLYSMELTHDLATRFDRYIATLLLYWAPPCGSLWVCNSNASYLTLIWEQLMYRAKKEGAVLLGLRHPWEH